MGIGKENGEESIAHRIYAEDLREMTRKRVLGGKEDLSARIRNLQNADPFLPDAKRFDYLREKGCRVLRSGRETSVQIRAIKDERLAIHAAPRR